MTSDVVRNLKNVIIRPMLINANEATASGLEQMSSLQAVKSVKQGMRPLHHLLVGDISICIHVGKASQDALMLFLV